MRLLPLVEEVLLLKNHFDMIYFKHVYRERNHLADRLSKEVTEQPKDLFIEEHTIYGQIGFYHRPFHEGQVAYFQ